MRVEHKAKQLSLSLAALPVGRVWLWRGDAEGSKSNPWVMCLVSAVLLLTPCILVSQQPPKTVKIADGTPVRLSLMDTLSSATNQVDDPIHLEMTEDVKVGDVVALPKGATAAGHVVEVEPRRRMGRAGKLNFSVDFVKAPDSSNVRVRATSTRHGQDKTGTVIVGTVLLSPLFLIMRGKDINIPKGTAFNAYIDGEREVTVISEPSRPLPSGQLVNAPKAPEQLSSLMNLISTPDGADITIDGKFVGSTPSTVQLASGDHMVSIEKPGFKTWQRTMAVGQGGTITLSAVLEKLQ